MKRFPRALLAALTVVGLLIVPLVLSPSLAGAADCRYVFGFKAIYDQIPDIVGQCKVNEHYNPENGDALQETDNGLLVWRKADNFTAYTDGYRTWVNGPFGLQERLNVQRFDWEPVDPKSVALTLTDMPAGFSETAGANSYNYNEQAAKASKNPEATLAVLEGLGRINGYTAVFDQLNASGLRGTFMVISDNDVFRTAEGAHTYFEGWENIALEAFTATPLLSDILTMSPVSAAAVGDESKAFRAIIAQGEGDNKVSVTMYFVVFRKGTVVSSLWSMAITTFADFDELLGYARVVESRIK